jgi:hypothetical protein
MLPLEKHYRPSELAKEWGVCTQSVIRVFAEEKGVLRIGNPETRFKRQRWTIRIPESLAKWVHDRITGQRELSYEEEVRRYKAMKRRHRERGY